MLTNEIISIIIPVYCNEESLQELYKIINDDVIVKNENLNFEIIFIDDGSKDNSLNILQGIYNKYKPIVKVIKLSRNFGQVNAVMAGLNFCSGNYAVIMSADLQDPPGLINTMIKTANKGNRDIVIATRKGRDESIYRVITSKIFYSIMKLLSFKNMPLGGFDFFLVSRRVIDIIVNDIDSNPFIQGKVLYTGFQTEFIQYKRRKRPYGKSKWSFSKKINALIDSVLSYSYFPIRLMSLIGLLVSAAGFLYAIIIIISYFHNNVPFPGWAPIMILILVLSGFQMLMLGIIGEYLWRTLDQVRRRPKYIIDKIYQ